MRALLLAALLVQAADAATTCQHLRRGTGRELNPLLGQTCQQVVLRKTAVIAPGLILTRGKFRTAFSVGLIVSGGVGVSVNLLQQR